jgi:hypothetical protein
MAFFLGVNNVVGAACATSDGASFILCETPGATPLTNYNLRGRRGLRPPGPLGLLPLAVLTRSILHFECLLKNSITSGSASCGNSWPP